MVAPLKALTVPHLELIAALLLARLVDKVKTSLKLCINKTTYWTDSNIVLSWIRLPPHTLQVFVSNRVVAILELSDIDKWRHVSTTDNPADCVSRGIKPSQLERMNLYWHGPESSNNIPSMMQLFKTRSQKCAKSHIATNWLQITIIFKLKIFHV